MFKHLINAERETNSQGEREANSWEPKSAINSSKSHKVDEEGVRAECEMDIIKGYASEGINNAGDLIH